jgi:pheromone shutdown protein TraB
VLVIVGAGHLAGIERELNGQTDAPQGTLAALNSVPPAAQWPKWIGIGLLVAIFGAITYAFYARGVGFGTLALRDWILFTGVGAALGALVGGGHVLSVLTALVVGPLKPFRPFVPVGAVAAAAEMALRRPRVADFEALRDDVIDWHGWWRNRVSRTLLVFMFSNFGMMIGEWMAGIRIFNRML